MIIISQLATLDDINKIEDDKNEEYFGLEATIDIYKEILEETLDGKKTITELIHDFIYYNMYLLKITCFFPDEECKTYNTVGKTYEKGNLYYIFYSDRTPDAGVHGFITNKQYKLLTDPDEYPDRWCEDNYEGFEHIFTEDVLEDDKKYLHQIYKYFDSNYQAVTRIDSDDGEEYVDGNTDEYFNVFTLYKKNNEEDDWYKIFEDDKRISSLIENMILYDVFKNYKGTYTSIKINKLDYCLEKYKDDNSFSFGWWSDNTMENAGLVENGVTEFCYTFKMNNDKINLTNQYISGGDKKYDIKEAYEQLWNKVINEHVMKDWLSKFFNEIEKYINC